MTGTPNHQMHLVPMTPDQREFALFRFMNSIFGHYTFQMGHALEVQQKILNG
jgi:hypothetical protein